jgi:hypothetical protein
MDKKPRAESRQRLQWSIRPLVRVRSHLFQEESSQLQAESRQDFQEEVKEM